MTWADILGHSFDQYYNLGFQGAGNLLIFNNFIHTLETYKINSDDTVMIMWTNVTREDRFIDGSWKPMGNIFTQHFYDDDFIKKYVDVRGCFERDIPLIHATRLILDKIGCKYFMMSMVDIQNSDQYMLNDKSSDIQDLLIKFESTLNLIRPSVHKVIFNYDYNTRPITGFDFERPDNHPLPLEHLEYAEKVLPEFMISDTVKKLVLENQNEALIILQD